MTRLRSSNYDVAGNPGWVPDNHACGAISGMTGSGSGSGSGSGLTPTPPLAHSPPPVFPPRLRVAVSPRQTVFTCFPALSPKLPSTHAPYPRVMWASIPRVAVSPLLRVKRLLFPETPPPPFSHSPSPALPPCLPFPLSTLSFLSLFPAIL